MVVPQRKSVPGRNPLVDGRQFAADRLDQLAVEDAALAMQPLDRLVERHVANIVPAHDEQVPVDQRKAGELRQLAHQAHRVDRLLLEPEQAKRG